MKRIYFDTAAGTLGNPSSIHQEGMAAKKCLEASRRTIAGILGVRPGEITFTSGGTEGNNLAILGAARAWQAAVKRPGHIITTPIEHRSVLAPGEILKKDGWTIDFLPVDRAGLVKPAALKKLLRPETVLVSVAYANNEIGAIQPLRDLAKIIRQFRKTIPYSLKPNPYLYPYLHTDACQAPRFLDLDVSRLGVDLMTLNSGKVYGPPGVGALYARRGVKLTPLHFGGGQEGERRGGTENVAGIAGFAATLEFCVKNRLKEGRRLSVLRDYFIKETLKLPGVELNGPVGEERLPNNVNLYCRGIEAEQLVIELDSRGVACSAGSACSLPTHDESYVIMALGFDRERAASSIRFTLGRDATKAQVTYVLKALPAILKKLRSVWDPRGKGHPMSFTLKS